MSEIPLYVVEELKAITVKVSAKVLTQLQLKDSNITGVHFFNGHPKEIIETLGQLDQEPPFLYQRFPAICLFQDFKEPSGKIIGIRANPKIQVAIINQTLNDYKAWQRYQENFIPILYPIYNELIKQIKLNGHIQGRLVPHTKIDRLYWGRQGIGGGLENKFNDYLDAIELQDLDLRFYEPGCIAGISPNIIF